MYVKVVLDNVGKKFGARSLFAKISAEIVSGQCLAVTGRNGSGKSTLLKIIAGLVRPSTGQIRFTLDKAVILKEGITYSGLVSPDMAMYNPLTGIENIIFWTKVSGVAYSKSQAEELCSQLGLDGAGSDQVSNYSTGMKQRLKLAVIKAVNPPVWLLDEPSTNLDKDGRNMVKALIADAVRQHAVIIATNEAEEAQYATSEIRLY